MEIFSWLATTQRDSMKTISPTKRPWRRLPQATAATPPPLRRKRAYSNLGSSGQATPTPPTSSHHQHHQQLSAAPSVGSISTYSAISLVDAISAKVRVPLNRKSKIVNLRAKYGDGEEEEGATITTTTASPTGTGSPTAQGMSTPASSIIQLNDESTRGKAHCIYCNSSVASPEEIVSCSVCEESYYIGCAGFGMVRYEVEEIKDSFFFQSCEEMAFQGTAETKGN